MRLLGWLGPKNKRQEEEGRGQGLVGFIRKQQQRLRYSKSPGLACGLAVTLLSICSDMARTRGENRATRSRYVYGASLMQQQL
jgi:hypothetical protein